MTTIRVLRAADQADLAVRGASALAGLIGAAIGERGSCSIAVSGGTTPSKMFAELVCFDPDWSRVHVFQVDERVAPDGDPDRNLTALQADLTSRIGLPSANLHPMPVTEADLDAAASSYAATLMDICGGVLDVVHLGLGDDGHTASWPPGDPVAAVTDVDVAIVGPYRDRRRMTLTPPAVNRARQVLWLVGGAGKQEAVRKLLSGDSSIPASTVEHRRCLLVADEAALGS